MTKQQLDDMDLSGTEPQEHISYCPLQFLLSYTLNSCEFSPFLATFKKIWRRSWSFPTHLVDLEWPTDEASQMIPNWEFVEIWGCSGFLRTKIFSSGSLVNSSGGLVWGTSLMPRSSYVRYSDAHINLCGSVGKLLQVIKASHRF